MVIASIAILAAILFPVFQKVRENARRASCSSNEKQLGLAFVQYFQDSDEKYPALGAVNYQNNSDWAGPIYQYVKSTAVFTCPDDSTSASSPKTAVSYGMNNNFAKVVGGNPNVGSGLSLSQLQSSAKTILLFEVSNVTGDVPNNFYTTLGGNPGGSAGGDGTCALEYTNGKYETGAFANVANAGTLPFDKATGLHSDGSNFLFADGHVKWLRGSAVTAGADNPTANDIGTSGVATNANCPSPTNGNFVGSIYAANTGNGTYNATFSYD